MNTAPAQPVTLIPIRQRHGDEPVVVVPYETDVWRTVKRIKRHEIYALPAGAPDEVFYPFWWMQLFGRDVTFWPVDAWSGHVMTLIAANFQTDLQRETFKAMRWMWGEPMKEAKALHETVWGAEPGGDQ